MVDSIHQRLNDAIETTYRTARGGQTRESKAMDLAYRLMELDELATATSIDLTSHLEVLAEPFADAASCFLSQADTLLCRHRNRLGMEGKISEATAITEAYSRRGLVLPSIADAISKLRQRAYSDQDSYRELH